jgi:hypothetical protein
MKKIAYLLILVPLVGGGWIIQDRARFDRAAWLADFEQLKSATEKSYANLKWSREDKKVDLVWLNTKALQELNAAKSNSAARRAIANFIHGFNDGHFHLESGPPKPVARVMEIFSRDVAPAIEFDMEPAAACAELGFKDVDHTLAIDGAARVARSTFASGTLRTPSGRTFGVIRIPLFRQYEYAAVCESAWQNFRLGRTGRCDENCQEEFSVHVKREVAQALADDARGLIRDGAEGVVIDLTGNGGGTEWAEFAAAALSDKPLKQPEVAFIRGQHWEKHFNTEIAHLDVLLKSANDSTSEAIQHARGVMLAMRDSARATCPASDLWKSRTAQPACWNVVKALPNAMPHEDYKFDRHYSDALYIMTDARTASASEQFAGILQDNGAARTLGTKTMGVGCGFTNGGNPTTLKNSRLVVWMPDCVRMRADGSNEFVGIKPNVYVDWGEDRKSKTAALLAALDKLPRP